MYRALLYNNYTKGEAMSKIEINIDESYVSFNKINCFENACLVLDHMLETLENPAHMNIYWEKVIPKIPQAYYDRDEKADTKEEVLYLVCSNAFYLDELFENAQNELAIELLNKCEFECC